MAKILVTGASGFIGSFITEAAVEKGLETFAGIRSTSSKRYLIDNRINFIELDFSDKQKLREVLSLFKKDNGNFDYIVHCAGVTKCISKNDFIEVNYQQTKDFHPPMLSPTPMVAHHD